MLHLGLTTQAVDLVQQGREDNLVIQNENQEGICVTLYRGKDLGWRGEGSQRDNCKRKYRPLT